MTFCSKDSSTDDDDTCCVDPDSLKELLECCFDPRHLLPSVEQNMENNTNYFMNKTFWDYDPCCHDTCHADDTKNCNKCSNSNGQTSGSDFNGTEESSTSPQTIPASDMLECCSRVNVRCDHVDNSGPFSELEGRGGNKRGACLSDSLSKLSKNSPISATVPPLVYPSSSMQKNLNKSFIQLYPKELNSANSSSSGTRLSDIRDSLKPKQEQISNVDNKKIHNHHHHHLLHLLHHDPEDANHAHTHDIIIHHHQGEQGHSPKLPIEELPHHHHHLHYEDTVNGQVIKHNFIIPNCDPLTKNPVVCEDDPNDSCNDFITSAVCNLAGEKYTNSHHQNIHGHIHPQFRLPSQGVPIHTPHHHHLHHRHHLHSHPDLHSQPHSHDDLHNGLHSNINDEPSSAQIKKDVLSNTDIKLEEDLQLTCKWQDCNLNFQASDLNKHVFENHLPDLPGSPTAWNSTLNNQTFQCEWFDCMFNTEDIDNLLQHISTHTEPEKKEQNHICEWIDPETGLECGCSFPSTAELTDHLIIEHVKSSKSSYECHWKNCNRQHKAFAQRQKIIRHLNTHTKHKPFECPLCHKFFSLDLMLKQHMRIHTGEKPYKCKICEKTFKTSSSLTIHMRIHSGNKPMVCNICGKRFNESSNLSKHMKIHFRKFKCDICLKSFNCQLKYMRHRASCEKKKHNMEMDVNKNMEVGGDKNKEAGISRNMGVGVNKNMEVGVNKNMEVGVNKNMEVGVNKNLESVNY